MTHDRSAAEVTADLDAIAKRARAIGMKV